MVQRWQFRAAANLISLMSRPTIVASPCALTNVAPATSQPDWLRVNRLNLADFFNRIWSMA